MPSKIKKTKMFLIKQKARKEFLNSSMLFQNKKTSIEKKKISMIQTKRNFGVEIECIGIARSEAAKLITAAGIPCFAESYNHKTKSHWKIVEDGSVGEGYNGLEVVSPKLSGAAGMLQIKQVLETLKKANVFVDSSCGLHIHIDASDLNANDIKNAINRYSKNESKIDKWMSPLRRDSNNDYCHKTAQINSSILNKNFNNLKSLAYYIEDSFGREYKLNVCSFLRHGTIEFRHHHGTLIFEEIKNWIEFCLNFIETSKCKTEKIKLSKSKLYQFNKSKKLAKILYKTYKANSASPSSLLFPEVIKKILKINELKPHLKEIEKYSELEISLVVFEQHYEDKLSCKLFIDISNENLQGCNSARKEILFRLDTFIKDKNLNYKSKIISKPNIFTNLPKDRVKFFENKTSLMKLEKSSNPDFIKQTSFFENENKYDY